MKKFNQVNYIFYDEPTSKEIKDFLDHICNIQRSNPQLIITKDIVYNELSKYGLKQNDMGQFIKGKDTTEYFKKWEKHFKKTKNIDAFNSPYWAYFFQFINGNLKIQDGFIKLYIPLDYEHLYEGANQIFDFLAKEDIKHLSKIGGSMRSDNVIIRLKKDDMDNALKIINFINKNKYIKNGLNKVNPFVPTINGIGIMLDDGRSYNTDMAKLVSDYVNALKNLGRSYGSVEGFTNYVNKNADSSVTLDTYTSAISKNRKFNMSDNKEYSFEQKTALFNDACRATVNKYSINQLSMAIQSVLNYNNYGWFTNGIGNEKYREELEKHVSSEDMLEIIKFALSNVNDMNYDAVENIELASIYSQSIFSYLEAINIDQICAVTLENYNKEQLSYAINTFLYTGRLDCFSQYKRGDNNMNYRVRLERYTKEALLNAIGKSLDMKGIEYTEDNMLNLYVSQLEKYIYGKDEEKSMSM